MEHVSVHKHVVLDNTCERGQAFQKHIPCKLSDTRKAANKGSPWTISPSMIFTIANQFTDKGTADAAHSTTPESEAPIESVCQSPKMSGSVQVRMFQVAEEKQAVLSHMRSVQRRPYQQAREVSQNNMQAFGRSWFMSSRKNHASCSQMRLMDTVTA
jgi:hypothetical protein